MESVAGRAKRPRPEDNSVPPTKLAKQEDNTAPRTIEISIVQEFDDALAAAALEREVKAGVPLSALGVLHVTAKEDGPQLYAIPPDGMPVAVSGTNQPPASYLTPLDSGCLRGHNSACPRIESLLTLRLWVARHWRHPYLEPDSRAWLSRVTGMSAEQVGAWCKRERRDIQGGESAAVDRPCGLGTAAAMRAPRDADGAEDEEDLRVMLRRTRKRVDGQHGHTLTAKLDAPGAHPHPVSTMLVASSGQITSGNGSAAPHLSSGGLVYDVATASALSLHSGTQAAVAGKRLPLPAGTHVAVPDALSRQGVCSLVLGPEGTLFAYDVAGTPIGTVPYGITPAQAAAAAAEVAAAHAAAAAARMNAYGLLSIPQIAGALR